MPSKQYKLSADEKKRMADRINYFRVMPDQVIRSVANFESSRAKDNLFVSHESKSILVNGRIMLLKISN